MKRSIVIAVMLALVACDNTKQSDPSELSLSTEKANPQGVDAAFCDTLEQRSDPRFSNYKECVYQACDDGDAIACEIAQTYNGNMQVEDTPQN